MVGPSGEDAVSVLYARRDEHVCEALTLPDASSRSLQQVEARMRTFFPGCRLEIQTVPYANAVTLGLRTSDDTNFHRPIHAGFRNYTDSTYSHRRARSEIPKTFY